MKDSEFRTKSKLRRTRTSIFVSFWETYSVAIAFIVVVLIGTFILRNPIIIIPALLMFMLYSDYKARKIYK